MTNKQVVDIDNMEINHWVRCRKETLNLNNRELARRANINERSLSMYMTGYRSWTLISLVKIVNVLGGEVKIGLKHHVS